MCGSDEPLPGFRNPACGTIGGSYFGLYLQTASRIPYLVATHTYVNPVVALILGWAIAGEALTVRFVFGGVVVIAAIALVGRATSREAQTDKIREQRRHASTPQRTGA